jgi:hypothetical protein
MSNLRIDLLRACQHNNLEEVRELVLDFDVNVNVNGGQCLQFACLHDNMEMIKFIISNGFKNDDYFWRMSSIVNATISQEKVELLEFLLYFLEFRVGYLSLINAIHTDNFDIVKLVLQCYNGPLGGFSDSDEISLLLRGCSPDIVNLFKTKGFEI